MRCLLPGSFGAVPLAVLFGALCLSQPADADNLRCDTSVVSRGLTFLEVVERCGKPDAEYRWAHVYVPGVYAPVEEWTYELGSNKFRRLLRFENGRLRSIELRPKPKISLDALNLP